MLRRLYDWTMGLAAHRHAVWALAILSFLESSVFPIPPDVVLIPLVLAARDRAWFLAGVCTLASVIGGFAGYAIGVFLFDSLGQWVIDTYHLQAGFEEFRARYQEWGAWIVAAAGFTPIPYKVFTIASGAVDLDPVTFGIASTLSRGARFFLVAALLWRFGAPIRKFIEDNFGWLSGAFFALLVGGFVLIKYVF